MLNINYDPGWQVVGGEPLSLAEFDGVIGINLPSARQTVELAYRPRAFFVGAAVSVLTLLGIVYVFWYVFWMRRRAISDSALTTALVVGLMSSLLACSESTPPRESNARVMPAPARRRTQGTSRGPPGEPSTPRRRWQARACRSATEPAQLWSSAPRVVCTFSCCCAVVTLVNVLRKFLCVTPLSMKV